VGEVMFCAKWYKRHSWLKWTTSIVSEGMSGSVEIMRAIQTRRCMECGYRQWRSRQIAKTANDFHRFNEKMKFDRDDDQATFN
jgi:hypothetical protein